MATSLPTLPLILITLLLPPLGVCLLAGCGPDLFINFCLTLLGYLSGTLHAFYLLYIYHDRNAKTQHGVPAEKRAPGICSDEIQNGLSAVYDADDAGWRKPVVLRMEEGSDGEAEPRFVGSERERRALWEGKKAGCRG